MYLIVALLVVLAFAAASIRTDLWRWVVHGDKDAGSRLGIEDVWTALDDYPNPLDEKEILADVEEWLAEIQKET